MIPQLCQLPPFSICTLFFCHHCQYLCWLVLTSFSMVSWSTCCCSKLKICNKTLLHGQHFLWRHICGIWKSIFTSLIITCHLPPLANVWKHIVEKSQTNGDTFVVAFETSQSPLSSSNHLSPLAIVPLFPFVSFSIASHYFHFVTFLIVTLFPFCQLTHL